MAVQTHVNLQLRQVSGQGADIGRKAEGEWLAFVEPLCHASKQRHLFKRLGMAIGGIGKLAVSIPVRFLGALFLSSLSIAGVNAESALKTAVFDFELVDTSAEGAYNGARADQASRLAALGSQLRERLAASGKFDLVDLAPAATAIEQAKPIHDCNGCVEDLAQALGADIAFVGYVQKVSNLILNINVEKRDGKTGQKLNVWSADIRGNTEESWFRGLKYLIDNRILAPVKPNG